eukprot:scaffold114_cov361-Pinguiococcus_pyrenoidosus.AAC.45
MEDDLTRRRHLPTELDRPTALPRIDELRLPTLGKPSRKGRHRRRQRHCQPSPSSRSSRRLEVECGDRSASPRASVEALTGLTTFAKGAKPSVSLPLPFALSGCLCLCLSLSVSLSPSLPLAPLSPSLLLEFWLLLFCVANSPHQAHETKPSSASSSLLFFFLMHTALLTDAQLLKHPTAV